MALILFAATFFVGYLPTTFKTSQRVMNLIAIYGAGLLVGAAIIVILPEGMLVLFESLMNEEVVSAVTTQPSISDINGAGAQQPIVEPDIHGSHGSFDPKVTHYVGLSIIFGFTVMLVLDQGFLILQERQMSKLSKSAIGKVIHQG